MKRIILAGLVGVLVSACDEEPKNNQDSAIKIEGLDVKNDPLAKIAPSIFRFKARTALQKYSSCITSDIIDEIREKSSPPTSTVGSNFDTTLSVVFKNSHKECEFWKSVNIITKPIYERIVREKTVPEIMYSFSAFEPSDGYQFIKLSVGVFEDIEVCQRLKVQYQEFGEGTAPCKKLESPLPLQNP